MLTKHVIGAGAHCTGGLFPSVCGAGSGTPASSASPGAAEGSYVGNDALTRADADDQACDPMPVG